MERPDILVLGGGGRQGDAWMTGVLAGLEDAHGLDLRECEYLVGTSAGAIVAAKLASGRSLRRPPHPQPPRPDPAGAASGGHAPAVGALAADCAMAIAAPLSRLGLTFGRMPAEMLRAAALRSLPAASSESPDFSAAFAPEKVRFDGRLRVVAVDRLSGRRVVFGSPGAPPATVAQALTASCALPLVFAPAVIGGREYVDGAVWSPTNADVAPGARGARVLILATMASLHGPWNAPLRTACHATMLVEAAALKARGARVRMITPDQSSAASIGPDLMSGARLPETQASGYAQGLAL
jgi:NTE family protein